MALEMLVRGLAVVVLVSGSEAPELGSEAPEVSVEASAETAAVMVVETVGAETAVVDQEIDVQ